MKAFRELEHRDSEVRRQDLKYSNESASIGTVDKRKKYTDAAIQAAPELSNEYQLTDQGVRYVDATTQTEPADLDTESVAADENEDLERRAPLTSGRSKTFPTTTRICTCNCSQPSPSAIRPQFYSARKQYRDQSAQTDAIENPPDAKDPTSAESKRTSFESNLKTPDRNRTFTFTSPSPSPFHIPSAKQSPKKSVDEVEVWTTQGSKESLDAKAPILERQLQASPTRPAPSPPLRCALCSAEMKLPILEPEPDPQPQLEPELQLPSPRSRGLGPTCTTRSSLECQQCYPPMPDPVLPRESCPSPVRSPQPKSRQSFDRESPMELYQKEALPASEEKLEEIVKGYNPQEDKFIQTRVIEETTVYIEQPPVADPVKRPSLPRLRLRPVPATRVPPQQPRSKAPASLPSAPVVLETALPLSKTITTSSSLNRSGVSDRAVFRGLHVATAAACDEDVDKWIEEITGTRVRRFLADLSAFDGLGFNTLAGVARRAARQRRGEVRAWERVREKRLHETDERDLFDGAEWYDAEAVSRRQGRHLDRRMGLVAGDESVNMRAER